MQMLLQEILLVGARSVLKETSSCGPFAGSASTFEPRHIIFGNSLCATSGGSSFRTSPSWRMCVLSRFSCVQVFATPIDCSSPGSSVYGIFQARILEWVAISFPGDLPHPGIEPGSPALQADSLSTELRRKPIKCRTSQIVYLGFSELQFCRYTFW